MIFSEFKAVVDLFKDVLALMTKNQTSSPEVHQKLSEIQSKVSEAYTTMLEIQVENTALRFQLAIRDMPFDEDLGTYYRPEPKGNWEYFCQCCADKDGKLCRLGIRKKRYRYECTVCGTSYQNDALRSDEEQASAESLDALIAMKRRNSQY